MAGKRNMDFRQSNQSSSRPASTPAVASTPADTSKKVSTAAPVTSSGSTGGKVRWLSILTVVVVFGISALLALLAFGFAHSSSPLESKLVDTKKYQAVFLNNGQVYFGNITSLNKQYVRLNNIYYLTQTSTTTNGQTATDGNYTLQKLGCQQIHYPYDQMVINRDQVTFWENLNDGGQVVTKIKEFQKQNPNGPDCSQVSNQTQASDTTQAQGGSTTNNSATGTDSTTKKQ